MECERDLAELALFDLTALGATDRSGKPPAIEKEHGPFPVLEIGSDLTHQGRREKEARTFVPFITFEIDHLDFGHGFLIDPLREVDAVDLTLLRERHAFQRGRGGAHQKKCALMLGTPGGHFAGMIAGRGLLLVRALVFLVHDDKAQVGDGGEHRGPRSKHDIAGSHFDAFPGEKTFPIGHFAVKDLKVVPEMSGKKSPELFGERDLGHKADCCAVLFQGLADRTDIKFAFAAAGDAVDQHGFGMLDGQGLVYDLERFLLLRRKSVILRRVDRRGISLLGFFNVFLGFFPIFHPAWKRILDRFSPAGTVILPHPFRELEHAGRKNGLIVEDRKDRLELFGTFGAGLVFASANQISRDLSVAERNGHTNARHSLGEKRLRDSIAEDRGDRKRNRHLHYSNGYCFIILRHRRRISFKILRPCGAPNDVFGGSFHSADLSRS